MHAMPGISLERIERMSWPELVEWWGHARRILEGPERSARDGQ